MKILPSKIKKKAIIECPACNKKVGEIINDYIYRIRKLKDGQYIDVDIEVSHGGSGVVYVHCPYCPYQWPYVTYVPGTPMPTIKVFLKPGQGLDAAPSKV